MNATLATTTRPPVRTVTAVGLVIAAAGLLIQMIGGVDMPPVPPGLVLLVVAAILVAATKLRWAPIVAMLVAIPELIATFAGGDLGADATDVLAGTWVRMMGAAIALIAGAMATKAAYARSR